VTQALYKRHVVITGASGRLGRAFAAAFSLPHTLVGLHCTPRSNKEDFPPPGIVESGAVPYIVQADFSVPGAADTAAAEIQKAADRLDVLILNAGITLNKLLLHTREEEWDAVLAVNYRSQAALLARLADTCMGSGSHAIIIGSLTGLRGQRGLSAYAASKGAIIGYVQDAARQYGNKGICVNGILPGWLKTAMSGSLSEEQFSQAISENCLGRGATCEEVAAFAVYLTGTQHISGQLFSLDSRIRI
jgi:3-oxoacyl-[acyl-carrier protein] reductase